MTLTIAEVDIFNRYKTEVAILGYGGRLVYL